MRILHLDPDDMDNPLSGGGPVRNYEIYRRLARRHEVTVLTPTFPGSTPRKERDGIRYLRLGKKIGDHGSSHHITFFLSLPAAIRRMEYDLLVEDFMPPASATFNPFFAKAPLIASVQWHFAELLSKQYKIPFWLWEKYGVRLYHNFVVLSQSMQQSICRRNPKANCVVIPNGVDDALFNLPAKAGDFVLYVGRIDFEQKGVDLLLKAYAQLPEDKRLPLRLAGHAFNYDSIIKRIGEMGLADCVTVIGRVTPEERNRLLSGCRFVCVPSRTETFGMVITEAMAAAKPVILFNQPPMNEVAETRNCLHITPFDTGEYSAGILRLIQETDQELEARGLLCRQWARQYQWREIADRQEQFYLEVLENLQK